jgi:hypothetical protein
VAFSAKSDEKGGESAEVQKRNLVRSRPGRNGSTKVSHGPVAVQCSETSRGRLRDVVGFGVVEWAMGRETFVQVGRWEEECVMGFAGRSRVRSEPDLDLDSRTQY